VRSQSGTAIGLKTEIAGLRATCREQNGLDTANPPAVCYEHKFIIVNPPSGPECWRVLVEGDIDGGDRMAQMKDGCVKPARGPIPVMEAPGTEGSKASAPQEARARVARVGYEAPDFEANAFVGEAGFKTIRLSESKGRWIVLCFYPGDFTFV
jgi:peroxiredoxin (alkyl hydroperoxide reductase subunit C)